MSIFTCCLLVASLFTLVSSLGIRLKDPQAIPGIDSDFVVTWFRTTDSDPRPLNNIALVALGPANQSYGTAFIPQPDRESSQGDMTFHTGPAGDYIVYAVGPETTLMANLSLKVVDQPSASTTSLPTTPSSHDSDSVTIQSSGSGPRTKIPAGTKSTTNSSSPTSTPTAGSQGGSSSTESTSTTLATSDSSSSPSSLSSSPPSSLDSPSSSSSQSHTNIIVGAVVGAIVFVGILVIVAYFFFKHRQIRPVSFHREMMVRSPGPSVYPASRAASPSGGAEVQMPSSIAQLLVQSGVPASISPSTPVSNPFRDPPQPVSYRDDDELERGGQPGSPFPITYDFHRPGTSHVDS